MSEGAPERAKRPPIEVTKVYIKYIIILQVPTQEGARARWEQRERKGEQKHKRSSGQTPRPNTSIGTRKTSRDNKWR